jgi:ABC-type lipoprotein export system ATPase subunit
VNLELHVNEFVAIVGESGSGKTTLLNVISGIDTFEDGEIYLNGEETSYFSVVDMENYRKKYIAFVFQNYNLIDSYTVLQNVEAPLILSGFPKDKVRARALEIITRVGLEKHIHHRATKLSGGQKQRVVIARALAKDCPIIAADEPTGNLDSVSARQILELLHEISKDKLVIIVTHDFEQVKEFATRKIRVFDGEIVEDQELKKVNKQNLPVIPDEEKRIKFTEFIKMALRNLFSVPKKTFLMIIVFSFFAFFVALMYGTFNVNMNDISYNYNYYFQNTSISRTIVRKTDKSVFSQADLDQLSELGNVQTVIPFDYFLDRSISLYANDDPNNPYNNTYLSGLFLPASVIENESILVAGRMPAAEDEIVIAITGDRLDTPEDYLNHEFVDESSMYSEASDIQSYTIVGIVDANLIYMDITNTWSGAYIILSDLQFSDMAQSSYFSYVSSTNFVGEDTSSNPVTYTGNLGGYSIKIDNTLPNDLLVMPYYFYEMTCESSTYCEATGSFTLADYYVERTLENITIRYGTYNLQETDSLGYITLNQATFDKFVYDDVYQVSVIANTDLNVKDLVKDIGSIDKTILTSKFKVFYPFDSDTGDDFTGLVLMLLSIGKIALLTITVLGSTLITYVIFKAIINTKLHDYAIFRTIGANQKMIKYFIYLENIFVALLSFTLFLAVTIFLKTQSRVGGLVYSLQSYSIADYFGFFVILTIMSLIISRKYCSRIFTESVNRVLKAE